MANRIYDIGIARQIGTYSDAVEAPANARWLITAGTPGLDAGGKVPPDFGAQAELAWTRVTQYLVRSSDIAAYAEVRARHLGSARPASLLLIVPELVQPEFLLEIEACAAKA